MQTPLFLTHTVGFNTTLIRTLLFWVSLLHLDPDPTIRIGRDLRLDPNLFDGLPSWSRRPRGRGLRLRIRVHIQRYPFERLDEASNYRGRFVVCELLSEANSWSGVEREEDEGIRDEVLLDSFIQEPVRIEFFRCRGPRSPTIPEGQNNYDGELTVRTPEVLPSMHQPSQVVNLGATRNVYRLPFIESWPDSVFLGTPDVPWTKGPYSV